MKKRRIFSLGLAMVLGLMQTTALGKENWRNNFSGVKKFVLNHSFLSEAGFPNGAPKTAEAFRKLSGNRIVHYFNSGFWSSPGIGEERISIIKHPANKDFYDIDRCDYKLLHYLYDMGTFSSYIIQQPQNRFFLDFTDPSIESMQTNHQACSPENTDSFLDNREKLLELLGLIYDSSSDTYKDFQAAKTTLDAKAYFLVLKDGYDQKLRKKLTIEPPRIRIYDGKEHSYLVSDYLIVVRPAGKFAEAKQVLAADRKLIERVEERSELSKPYDF